MELTYDQILSAATGTVRFERNELGLELHRFTRTQESFFYETHPLYCHESFFNGYFGRNCRTGAGITLDFICDATELIFEFNKVEQTNNVVGQLFDLYVDDEFAQAFPVDSSIRYSSSGESKRFTLYFPNYMFPIISGVELVGATVFLPQKKQAEILFLGDSITQGGHASHPANTYVMRVARNLDVGILNQASSGFVYDARSLEHVCCPKVIVTAYGINDYFRKDLVQMESQTVAFFQKLRSLYGNVKIVSILPLWTSTFDCNENFGVLQRECLKKVYAQFSDYILDGHDLVPHDPQLFNDGLHPNDEGFSHYGNNLTKVLQKLL